MTTKILPIGQMKRRDGTFDPIAQEAWMRSVSAVLSEFANQVSAVLAAGNAVTITLAASTVTIAVNKIAASADAAALTSSVVGGTAGVAYTATEQAMLNDIKAKHNDLLTDVGAIRTALNDLKAKARTANHLAT